MKHMKIILRIPSDLTCLYNVNSLYYCGTAVRTKDSIVTVLLAKLENLFELLSVFLVNSFKFYFSQL